MDKRILILKDKISKEGIGELWNEYYEWMDYDFVVNHCKQKSSGWQDVEEKKVSRKYEKLSKLMETI